MRISDWSSDVCSSDLVLLERKKLTSGTTWHAAGLVRAALHTQNLTRLAQHSVKLYRELEAETGQATGFKQNGSISIAPHADRWEAFRRGASEIGSASCRARVGAYRMMSVVAVTLENKNT